MKFAAHRPINRAQHYSHDFLSHTMLEPDSTKVVYNPAQTALVNLDLPPHTAKIADNSRPLPTLHSLAGC